MYTKIIQHSTYSIIKEASQYLILFCLFFLFFNFSVNAIRTKYVWHDNVRTSQLNTLPPHNITLYKGEYHVVLSRSFVDYVLENNTAKDFLKWLKTTGHPDETYFNTLVHNPQLGVPGIPKGNQAKKPPIPPPKKKDKHTDKLIDELSSSP